MSVASFPPCTVSDLALVALTTTIPSTAFSACVAVAALQIRVFCRVRPHPQSAVKCLTGGTSLALTLDNKDHPFSFDKVFAPGTSQQQVRYSSSEDLLS